MSAHGCAGAVAQSADDAPGDDRNPRARRRVAAADSTSSIENGGIGGIGGARHTARRRRRPWRTVGGAGALHDFVAVEADKAEADGDRRLSAELQHALRLLPPTTPSNSPPERSRSAAVAPRAAPPICDRYASSRALGRADGRGRRGGRRDVVSVVAPAPTT